MLLLKNYELFMDNIMEGIFFGVALYNHLSPQLIRHKKIITYKVGNPGPGLYPSCSNWDSL